jgi:DNA-binding transcriptional regulator GbsR (MarR family)
MSWQVTLRDVLSGYFGDQTFEEGVREMVFVTECNLDYHQLYLSAIEEGIKATIQDESDVIRMIMESNAYYVKNIAEAREFLEKLHLEYLAQYNDAQ